MHKPFRIRCFGGQFYAYYHSTGNLPYLIVHGWSLPMCFEAIDRFIARNKGRANA
jgi:hypothetical protein